MPNNEDTVENSTEETAPQHTTSQDGEDRELFDFEKAWIIYQFCGIPYETSREIVTRDEKELQFLMHMAALKKAEVEEIRAKEEAREDDLEKKFGSFADSMAQMKPPS
jgi:hypothetical protein